MGRRPVTDLDQIKHPLVLEAFRLLGAALEIEGDATVRLRYVDGSFATGTIKRGTTPELRSIDGGSSGTTNLDAA